MYHKCSSFEDEMLESEQCFTEDKGNLSDCDEISDPVKHLRLSMRHQELQLEILEIDRVLCDRRSKNEFSEVKTGENWDKRISALENLLASLTLMMDNMNRLEQQLQTQFSSDKAKRFNVPDTYHKCLLETFQMMATFLNEFESQVQLTTSVKNASCNVGQIIPNQLECHVRLNSWFNCVNNLRQCLNRLFAHKND